MQRLKQSIALLLALIMVMLVIPTAMLSAFASVNPVAQATLITSPIYKEYKTDQVILDDVFVVAKKYVHIIYKKFFIKEINYELLN